MNIDERERLSRLLQQLAEARVGSKDVEADRLIQEVCRTQPDAHYLLVQRNLLLEHAVENLQAEIARMKREQDLQRAPAGDFLDNSAWGNTPVPPVSTPRAWSPAPTAPAPAPAAISSPRGSGFLGTLATTAAGVVAGSFLFQGIEHLIGSHSERSGFLSDSNPLLSLAPGERVVVEDSSDYRSDADNDLSSLGPDDGDSDWV